jgi:U3 small nucleolar RNA-associated protein 20
MMPLVKSFLENEAYEKYDYLIEEACNAIGSMSYILNWPKYLKVVEYYIKILPKNIIKPKIVTKILISVLDAFHFDLSNNSKIEKDSELNNEIVTNNSNNIKKKQIVSKELAAKIHSTISKNILPVLFKCLTKRLDSENEHKMNKHEDQDEQILKVPMALAILKLLKNLPLKTFETHLPGLLYKVCEMLKSRSISVRNTTRECLMKMINSLPDISYYHYVFKELANSLTRGYQVWI